jgi:Flp pilus assembly protein TadG
MTAPRRADERGLVTIEVIAYYTIVMVVVVGVLHLFVAGYAAVVATNAARAAARTASLGGDPQAAAAAALPAALDATVEVDGGQATVQVQVPALLFGEGGSIFTLTRSADMPETGEPVDVAAGVAGSTEGPA